GDAREDRAALGRRGVADADHVVEAAAAPEEIKDGLGRVAADVDAAVAHRRDGERIQLARFKPRALDVEAIAAELLQERGGHLAGCRVVDAQEENARLHATRILP